MFAFQGLKIEKKINYDINNYDSKAELKMDEVCLSNIAIHLHLTCPNSSEITTGRSIVVSCLPHPKVLLL